MSISTSLRMVSVAFEWTAAIVTRQVVYGTRCKGLKEAG
jgi:hypothetical protein